jgi:hypothetical protein
LARHIGGPYHDVNRTQNRLPDRLRTERYAVDFLEGVLRLVGLILGWLFGWPLSVFRRWIDRQPDRDPSQISSLEKLGRLALGISLTLCVLIPLGWLIFK